MRSRGSLALLVASLLLVVLASGVAAAQTGDGTSLVGLLEELVRIVRRIAEILGGLGSVE